VFYCGNKTASNEVSHAVFSENVVASLADIPHRMSFAGESNPNPNPNPNPNLTLTLTLTQP
jgi:hypothetical protein